MVEAKESKKKRRPASCIDEQIVLAVHEVDGRLEKERPILSRRRKRGASDAQFECAQCHMRQHARCVHLPPDSGAEYTCPPCLSRDGRLFHSGATLIVVPQTLLQQWLDEVHKHIDASLNLRVLVCFLW